MTEIEKIAHIRLGDFRAIVRVDSYKADESTGMMTIMTTDGTIYETHVSNVVIVKTRKDK